MTKKQLEERNERLVGLLVACQAYVNRIATESNILAKNLEDAIRKNPDAKD